MTAQNSTGRTRVLLSFSSAYEDLARRLANDLKAAHIEVRYDKWKGGGGTPAAQSVAQGVDDAAFVLPLLTPSDAARTWIGDEWKRTIYDKALARKVDVLPVRGEGDLHVVPDFLLNRSFADLSNRDYAQELRRLVETIRDRSNDPGIELLADGREANGTRSPLTLPEDPLVLEMGEELAPLFHAGKEEGLFLNEILSMMRDGLHYETGVQFPGLRTRVVSDVPPSFVRVVINDIPETEVEIRPESVMINESVNGLAQGGITAEEAVNPATGAKCAWIPADQAAAANDCGFTTWDAYDFLVLTLSTVLRRKAADFIGIEETRAMLKQIEPVFPHLVAESVPKTVSLFEFTDVLRRLIAEGVSIRNFRQILMALAEWGRVEHDPLYLTEYVRAALKRQITYQLSHGTNTLVVFLLHPDIEATIRDSIRHTATGSYVDLEPARVREILDAIREPLGNLPDDVQVPQILTMMEIRSSVRRLVALSIPRLHVVSYQELRPDADIQPVGRISLDGFSSRTVSVGGVPLELNRKRCRKPLL